MEAIEYFERLEKWSNSFYNAAKHTKSRRISEYWGIVDEAMFSQIEINRILPNK